MWLFEARGFYSMVAYDPKKDVVNDVHRELASSSENPDGWLLVRARVEEDLLKFEQIAGVDLRITTDKSADYAFRGLITREDFKAYLAKCVDQINYDSHFKEVVRANSSQPEKRYPAMMKIWNAMADLQPYSPYGFTTTYYPAKKGSEGGAPTITNKGWVGSGSASQNTAWGNDVPDSHFDSEDWWSKQHAEEQEYYENVFGAGTDNPDYSSTVKSLLDDLDDEDWGRYAPGRVWNSTARRWEDPVNEDWQASNYWFETRHLRGILAVTPVGEISDEDIESMTDDTFGLWMEALDKYGPHHILSEEEIKDLCGDSVETGEEVS